MRHLHDRAWVGDGIEVVKPIGAFTLDISDGLVVFLSAGVGVTPMIAMLDGLVQAVKVGAAPRPVWFIHVAMNWKTHAFAEHLGQLADDYAWLKTFTSYSKPGDGDMLGKTHDSEDYISVETLKSLLPFGAHHLSLRVGWLHAVALSGTARQRRGSRSYPLRVLRRR